VLLSPATQYACICDRGNTAVDYRFGVDGTLIDFRHGDLDIGIGHPDEERARYRTHSGPIAKRRGRDAMGRRALVGLFERRRFASP
jgi:hypothetical protein